MTVVSKNKKALAPKNAQGLGSKHSSLAVFNVEQVT
jgi:hypothetical protein